MRALSTDEAHALRELAKPGPDEDGVSYDADPLLVARGCAAVDAEGWYCITPLGQLALRVSVSP